MPAPRPGIQGKQASVRLSNLRRRQQAGEDTRGMRASIRIGAGVTAVLTGADDVSTWDDEELRQGMRRDKNGRFQGRKPIVVPKVVHDELLRRTMRKAATVMRDDLVEAVELLGEIIRDPEAADKDRIKAAEILIERVLGKVPEKVEVSMAEEPWRDVLLEGAVSLDDEESGDTIIDVEEAQ